MKHQQVSGLAANHFKFQDTFVAPIAYTRTLISSESPADSVGTLVLNGGGGGVSYTTSADGQLIASLVGTVYNHDSARSNVFIVSKQTGVSHYRNVLRGFKQGIDKIDLSQTGITKFSQLTINKKNWAVINGLSQIHGVEIKTTALDPAGQNVTLLYLDALNVSQLSANDFIFSDVTFSSPKSDSEAVAAPNLVTNPVPERPAQTTSIPPTTVLEREMTRRPFPQFNIRPMPPLPQVELPSWSDILQQLRETELPPIREIPAITPQPFLQVELPPLSNTLQQLRETELLPIQEIPAITPQPFPQFALSTITMPSIPSVRAEKTAYRMVSKNQPWNSGALSSLFTLRKREQPMTYTVVLADGSRLPTWLALDTEKNVLTGILGTGTADKASLKVTATDEKGFSVSTILELQAYANVLDVDAFQTVAVSDDQAAINASNDFSKVTATGGNHVLFMNGSMSSANLLGNGKNKVIVAGSSNKITLGEGNNDIRLTGSSSVLVAGNGNNAVNATGSFIDITLGNGNNTIHGEVEKLIVGNGDNTITNSATLAKLKLGEGKNTVVLSGDMATINVGRGHYNLRYSGDMGKLVFNKSIPFDRLWFKHHQLDLHVSVGGSKGKVTLKNWYASTPERPSAIIAGDGKRLSKNDVEPLVQAMSTFASSDAVTRNFTPAEKQLLQPILAANWR
ncbi:putative Ig domain-containing protein [Candidatus Regiella insecticola]|uniref:putative Ig domain-containing protein n=1 Tax=Candidatus Regiella insecticola TaxID=138073 RepID=UPI0003103539